MDVASWLLVIGWVLCPLWVLFVILTNRHVHPKVLFFLFMTELWERFSYYGMRAFLVLYLYRQTYTGAFGMKKDTGEFGDFDESAYGIYAAYGALVYLTPLAGGFLADRLLGFRKSIIWGAILMATAQFTLSFSTGDQPLAVSSVPAVNALAGVPGETALSITTPAMGSKTLLYVGLGLLVIGNGFFKPNISSLIGKFYGPGDPRRDGAFTIFYMGINIGAFLAPLTCGAIAEQVGWNYGFLLAGIGMVIGLLIFLYTSSQGYLEHYADPPGSAPDPAVLPAQPADQSAEAAAAADLGNGGGQSNGGPRGGLLVYLGTFLLLPVVVMLIRWNDVLDFILAVVGLSAIAYMLYLSSQYTVAERQRIWVIVVLLFFTSIFWGLFELAGSALNVFTDQYVDKTFSGTFSEPLPTSAFQAVNAFFIMVFAPIFAWMWVRLAKSGVEPAAPFKFVFGLLFLGAGFLVLNLGRGAASAAMMPAIFMILLYLLHTLGELSLSPVGLSLVTKLAPAKMVGFMMGFWFLSSAIGIQSGKWISSATVPPKGLSPQQSMEHALKVFNYVGFFAIGSAVLLLLLAPRLTKWMHGVR
ncbi:MAG TPA: peptide MFS transporter [Fimbriiglobus sp.]|nr:peptide MFS transporter [Fimbriiglobus sp.]